MYFGIVRVLIVVVFLYLMWRNMRDDYHDKELIKFCWSILLVFFLGGRLLYGLFNWRVWNENWLDWVSVWVVPGFSYLGGYLAVLIYTVFSVNKYEWKLWNVLEDLSIIFTLFILALLISDFSFSGWTLVGLGRIMSLAMVLILASMVSGKYRSFNWYYSGKKGFLFFWINGWYSFIGLGVLFWLNQPLWMKLLYLAWNLLSVIGLFILGDVVRLLKIKNKKIVNESK
jgi:hypothetical protein